MKNNVYLSLFLLVFLVFASCSKEKRLENMLKKKEGTWSINRYNCEKYKNNEMQNSETYYDIGEFVFSKKGVGSANYVAGPVYRSYDFRWSNTEDQIFLVNDGFTNVCDVTIIDKQKIEINYVLAYEIGGQNYADKINMILIKN